MTEVEMFLVTLGCLATGIGLVEAVQYVKAKWMKEK